MTNFFGSHPLFTVLVVGSIIGTLVSSLFKDFAYNNLVQNPYFCLGNLGINVFIHRGFQHLLGNMVLIIPCTLIIENYNLYSNSMIFTVIIIYTLLLNVLESLMGNSTCGISGIAYMLFSMCVWYNFPITKHWYSMPLLAFWGLTIIIEIVSERKNDNTNMLAHMSGYFIGTMLAIFVTLLKM